MVIAAAAPASAGTSPAMKTSPLIALTPVPLASTMTPILRSAILTSSLMATATSSTTRTNAVRRTSLFSLGYSTSSRLTPAQGFPVFPARTSLMYALFRVLYTSLLSRVFWVFT